MQRIAVGLAVDGDRTHTEFFARADHAQCNLPAIGHQNLFEHESAFSDYELLIVDF
jgi:hypothetical protein